MIESDPNPFDWERLISQIWSESIVLEPTKLKFSTEKRKEKKNQIGKPIQEILSRKTDVNFTALIQSEVKVNNLRSRLFVLRTENKKEAKQ